MNDQCTVREEEGKLVFETDKFTSVREIQGEDMVEVGLILIHSMINGSMFCFLEVQLQYDEGIINRFKHLFLSADGDCWLRVPHQEKQAGLMNVGNYQYGHQIAP